MKLAGLWRLLAIGVALMAWLDPPVGVRTVPPVVIDVAVRLGREADAQALLTEVARTLPPHVSLGPVQAFGPGAPAPCTSTRPCLVLGAPLDTMRLAADVLPRTTLVSLPSTAARAARVVQISAPQAHQLGAALATVTIDSRGLGGTRGRVVLTANRAPVGSAEVNVVADGRIDVEVPWVPPDMSPVVLEASVEVTADGGSVGLESASALAAVRLDPWPVLLHEARPSWATTFVRRAIEADPRFVVSAQTRVAPEVLLGRSETASAGGAGGSVLSEAALDAGHIVVVGAAEQLSPTEVARLDRFVRLRGGALVLVPDREWSGPVTRLLSGRWQLSTTVEPRRIGPFSGREWLLADQLSPGAVPVISNGEVVGAVVTPMGHGLTLVMGALDAWRFRGDGVEWNRFWAGLLADVAGRTPNRLQVTVEPADRDGRLMIDLRRRSMQSLSSLDVTATQQCGNDAPRAVRVWPGLHLDQFRIDAMTAAQPCVITVTAGADTARVTLPASSVAAGLGATALDAWASPVVRAGGSHVTTGAAGLSAHLADIAPPDPVDAVRYPMRSPLWMLVFLGSLGLEWWLRRRAGGR